MEALALGKTDIVGPIFDTAHAVLQGFDEFEQFRENRMSRKSFGAFIDRIAPQLVHAGLPSDDMHFCKRYPRSSSNFVRDALDELAGRGIVTHVKYDEARFDSLWRDTQSNFEHGPFKTYIYPEEARLLYAIVDVLKPRSVVFLGSYYGYWAHWAAGLVNSYGGQITLVDPDSRTRAIVERNCATFAYGGCVAIVSTTGEEFLDASEDSFDLVVLDAEGPRDHPDPEQRGKRIYAPLLRHCLPRMAREVRLVCHNLLLQNHCRSSFFEGIIRRNRGELGSFLKLVDDHFEVLHECATTEGVGVAGSTFP